MIISENTSRAEHIAAVTKAMMAAARTAPKSKGIDRLEIVTVSGDDLNRLAAEMKRYGEQSGFKFFLRDAVSMEQSEAVMLIGSGLGTFGLDCGFCGFPTCAEKLKHQPIPCALNMVDLGIAIGSAVSIAADFRIDNRVMYSVARAALNLGILTESKAAFGIALSCSGKSPFFDRKYAPQAEE